MSSIELQFKEADEIALPATIATSPLSLAEIGACVVLLSLPILKNDPTMLDRMNNEEMHTQMRSLKEKGVFSVAASEDSQLTMKLNLGAVGV